MGPAAKGEMIQLRQTTGEVEPAAPKTRLLSIYCHLIF